MTQSMTGFASTTLQLTTPSGTIPATLTIKTLNNKFLDINCKLPYALAALELTIIKQCKEMLHRGTVYCTLYMANPHALKSEVFPSIALAQGYMQAIAKLQKELNVPGTVTIADFITLPNLFEAAEGAQLGETEAPLLAALKSLLEQVVASRQTEGAALQKDLETRMHNIEAHIALIEPRAETVSNERRQKLQQELKVMLTAAAHEIPEAHVQVLCNAVEKIDVNEELVRLKTHLQSFFATIQESTIQKGKKLDFILQEMFREINTLNAKLPDAIASKPIIAIKVELEKAREQVQNIV